MTSGHDPAENYDVIYTTLAGWNHTRERNPDHNHHADKNTFRKYTTCLYTTTTTTMYRKDVNA